MSGPHDPFDDGSSGLLSNYTDDMKMVINAQGYLIDDEYYLFVIDKPASGSKLGYMPRGKQAGFIFTDPHGTDDTPTRNTRIITTMAHELGHGAFTLKHTWSDYNSLSEHSTDNLMDYNNGTQLWKLQWDRIHDPVTVLGLFESDESGASFSNEDEITGYVISDSKAYIRMIAPPYQIKEPKEILPQGSEVVLVISTSANKYSAIKFLDKREAYLTSTSNITPIIKLAKPEKYLVTADFEAVVLPYSTTKAGKKIEKDSYVTADKSCGDYYQVKENTNSNSGWWIAKTSLKRVGDDTADNFDWMKTVSVESTPTTKEVLDAIATNRNGINDRSDRTIYGPLVLRPDEKNRGYFYPGNHSDFYPQFTGTEFEKKVKRLILDELGKEGSWGSINTYDGEIFTWGRGFAVQGSLMDIFKILLEDKKMDFKKVLNNVGIRIVDGAFWVLTPQGAWLKDIPGRDKTLYSASKYIASDKRLLSFFIELAEKKEYKEPVANAQNKVFEQRAGKFPDYILNKDRSGYNLSWDDDGVTVIAHLSHWCGYSWSVGERYKDTNGELGKIIYTYIYNTVLGYPDTRYGDAIETNIFRWNSSFPLIDNLGKFGKSKGIGLTKLEETWKSNIIELEFKKDKEKKLRALEKNTKNQLAETNSVLIIRESGFIVLNNNATKIKYEIFQD